MLCTELVRQGISTAGPNANDLHDRIVGRVERELIQQVLQACDRVQIKAAARLGINRNTLHKKLAEYRLDETDAGTSIDLPDSSGGRHSNNGTSDQPDLNDPDKDNGRLSARARVTRSRVGHATRIEPTHGRHCWCRLLAPIGTIRLGSTARRNSPAVTPTCFAS